MDSTDIDTFAKMHGDASKMLSDAVNRFSLSARSYFRIIRVARTIADLSRSDEIRSEHIAEALSYREA